MHFSHYCIPIIYSDDQIVLVNGLTGEHSVLDAKESKQFIKWQQRGIDESDNEFLNELVLHKYVFSTQDEEDALEKRTLDRAKESYEESKSEHSVVFVISYDCNFKCPYCYENEGGGHVNGVMSKEQVDKIFSIYNNRLDTITLYGGEPLMLEHEGIIRYIFGKAPDARYAITTNGFYLEEYLPLLRGIKIDHIMVTLDGNKDTHNRSRVLKSDASGTFDKIIDGIKAAFAEGMCIKIRMNIFENNLESCLSLREQLKKEFAEPYNSNRLTFELQPLFQLSLERKDALNRILLTRSHRNCIDHRQNNSMHEKTSRILQSIYSRKPFVPLYCACGAEAGMRFYDCEGDIYSCVLALGNKVASIGSYDPVIQMKEYGYLYRNIETIVECIRCRYKFLCGGGCANYVMDESGTCLRPNCEQIQYEVLTTLPRIYKDIMNGDI